MKSTTSKNKRDPIEIMSWIGTISLVMGPYLMSYKIGFVLALVGVILITPPIYKQKQWNLLFLNLSSVIGYTLQIFNLI